MGDFEATTRKFMKVILLFLFLALSFIAHESWVFTVLMVVVLGKIMVNDLRASGWRI